MYKKLFITVHASLLWLRVHQLPHLLANPPLVHKYPSLSFSCQDHGQTFVMKRTCYHFCYVSHVNMFNRKSRISKILFTAGNRCSPISPSYFSNQTTCNLMILLPFVHNKMQDSQNSLSEQSQERPFLESWWSSTNRMIQNVWRRGVSAYRLRQELRMCRDVKTVSTHLIISNLDTSRQSYSKSWEDISLRNFNHQMESWISLTGLHWT